MKFLVLTLADDKLREMGDIAASNRSHYANKHGYDFFYATERLDDRPASWSKILLLEKYLSDYDWILWTDADALIMNYERRLEDIVEGVTQDLIFTRDTLNLNAGVFFVRNTDWSKRFLRAVYTVPIPKQFKPEDFWEQSAIVYLLNNSLNAVHVKYMHQSVFNSYGGNYRFPFGGKIPHHLYQPGDFIVHYPGVRNEVALRLMKNKKPSDFSEG